MRFQAGPALWAKNGQNGVAPGPITTFGMKEKLSQFRELDTEIKTLKSLMKLEKDPSWKKEIGIVFFTKLKEMDALIEEVERNMSIQAVMPETKAATTKDKTKRGNGGILGFLIHLWPFHKKNGDGNGHPSL